MALRDDLSPEQWKAYRAEITRRYRNSEKGKASEKRTNASPLAKERYARYRQTEKYRAAQERRRQKELEASRGWKAQLKHRERIRAERPEYTRAWQAVSWALEFGLLTRPDGCERCGRVVRLHAHHLNGYDREHWLDVLWVCAPCHKIVH